eukprot:CAMPEP_0179007186 /NCGR_PEP_ID=MMETSP0795-20121207/15005_1 /TAXON_ID=88552 /ORGANISM="Amoebophrya sp., Strain Ameob2" /LENGTH=45 /DNA_ID= /DNA_START= /DNA_END= /DNA_ORIENTATION=
MSNFIADVARYVREINVVLRARRQPPNAPVRGRHPRVYIYSATGA